MKQKKLYDEIINILEGAAEQGFIRFSEDGRSVIGSEIQKVINETFEEIELEEIDRSGL